MRSDTTTIGRILAGNLWPNPRCREFDWPDVRHRLRCCGPMADSASVDSFGDKGLQLVATAIGRGTSRKAAVSDRLF